YEIAGRRAHAAFLDTCSNTVSGTLQSNQVRFRAATRECTETLWTIVEQIAEPTDHARLEHCGRWTIAPRTCVLIEHRCERVCPDTDRQRRWIELAEVARARNAHRVRGHVVFETSQDFFERDSLFW